LDIDVKRPVRVIIQGTEVGRDRIAVKWVVHEALPVVVHRERPERVDRRDVKALRRA